MGYTQYWLLKSEGSEKNYKLALADIRKILAAKKNLLAGGDGNGTPQVKKGISFNGKGKAGHEAFLLPGTLKNLAERGDYNFNFCKTAQKPYDVVVVACLAILAARLGTDVKVSSDGTSSDWEEGVALASKVLKEKIPNPRKKGEET